jgi:hypothetical protein
MRNRKKVHMWATCSPVELRVYSVTHVIWPTGLDTSYTCRSQWSRGLRRRSAAARLLGLRVRISPGAWMSVTCECCVSSRRGLCVDPTECGVSEYDHEASIREGHGPTTGRSNTHTHTHTHKKATCIAEAVHDTELLSFWRLINFRYHKSILQLSVN